MRGSKPQLRGVGSEEAAPPVSAPDFLAPEARAEWERVFPILSERRLLTDADLGMLENYCVAFGRARQLDRRIQTQGDEADLKMIRMQDKMMSTARQLAVELGLTPSARSRGQFTDPKEAGGQNDLFSTLDL